MPDTDIRSFLLERIDEAEADLDRLRAALKAVDGPQSAPAPRKSRAADKPQPAPKAAPLDKLLKVITDKPGITTTTLAKVTGGDQPKILELLKEAEGKQVRRTGRRRATRWFVI